MKARLPNKGKSQDYVTATHASLPAGLGTLTTPMNDSLLRVSLSETLWLRVFYETRSIDSDSVNQLSRSNLYYRQEPNYCTKISALHRIVENETQNTACLLVDPLQRCTVSSIG
jgi:hypothetical protein